jgi:hypothetical protein
MKTQIITIFLFLSASLVFGQTPRVLSLEEALSLGQTNNLDLKNQAIQVELAQRERNKIEARRSPIINATGDLRSNLVLPTTIIPAGAFGGGSEDCRKFRVLDGIMREGVSHAQTQSPLDP